MNRNGRGPANQGPLTGRGRGNCRPNSVNSADYAEQSENREQSGQFQAAGQNGAGPAMGRDFAGAGYGAWGVPRGCGMGFCGGRGRAGRRGRR